MDVFTGLIITDPQQKAKPGKLVVDEGKVAALIPTSELKEKVYIAPGFIDSHVHPLETGLAMIYPNLSAAGSVDEIMDVLAAEIHRMPDTPVLMGFNFEPERLKEHRYLYRRELDRISRKVPIFIYRVDGHSAAVNTPVLALLNDTSVEGIELDGAGKPTGVVRGKAYEILSEMVKRLLFPDIIRKAFTLTAEVAIKNGIVAMGAMVGWDSLTKEEWTMILDALSEVPINMIPFPQTWNPDVVRELGIPRIGGCLLLDGSFGSHTAALSEDYFDTPGYRGVLYQEDRRLFDFIHRAVEMDLQTSFHAIGDRAIEQLVKCHEQIINKGLKKNLRHRIEHSELLSPELIKRISDLGLILAVQPEFEHLWGGPDGMYARRLGKRWQNTNPYRVLVDHNVMIAGGSDSPITPLEPLRGIYAAMNLPNVQNRLNGSEALMLFTTNSAYSLGLEKVTGKLMPQMEANFICLSDDPRENPACHILATYYRGRPLFEATSICEKGNI